MCYSPITLKNGIQVPCGKCQDCLSAHRSQWRQRMFFESKMCKQMYFATLTLDEDNVKLFNLPDGRNVRVPSKEQIQKFHKRLRRYIQYYHYSIDFKFFLVSEYGPLTFRPHYHALYFTYGKDTHHFRDIVKKVWKYGFSDVNLCRNKSKSCSYVSNYLIISKINPYNITKVNGRSSNNILADSCNTFVLASRSLGNEYFKRRILKQKQASFLKFVNETNIISIIKQNIEENFTNINNLRVLVNTVKPYANSLFEIPINSKFTFTKLNKLYSYEIGYSYQIICSSYFRALYLLRDSSLSDNERAILELQRKDKEKKLHEFNKTFNKKRYRNAQHQIDII